MGDKMVQLKEWTAKDKNNYDIVYAIAKDLFKKIKGSFWKIDIDGQEHFVYQDDELYMFFHTVGIEKTEYTMFATDTKGRIAQIALTDYEVELFENSDAVFRNRKTGIVQSLSLVERTGYTDDDGYNGVVEFLQYDQKRDIRVRYTYRHMMNTEKKIFGMCLETPTSIALKGRNGLHKLPFLRMGNLYVKDTISVYENPIRYHAVAILEYGVKEVLQKGALQTVQEYELSRYRKMIASFDGNASFLPPIGKLYTLEEVEQQIKLLGFETEVPSFLLSFYNKDNDANKEVAFYEEIAKFFEVENVKSLETAQVLSFEITNF